MGSLTSSLGSMIGAVTSITMTIVTVPFVLFYMLKDGPKLLPNIKRMLPDKQADVIGDHEPIKFFKIPLTEPLILLMYSVRSILSAQSGRLEFHFRTDRDIHFNDLCASIDRRFLILCAESLGQFAY